MYKKRLNILPLSYTGGPKTGLTFKFLLWYDQKIGRLVTVKTPWADWKPDPTKPRGLHLILQAIMEKSNIPLTMTESEFLNLEWKQFNNVKISDKLL